MTITLENGKQITLNALNNSPANKYIKTMSFNGQPHPKNYIDHFNLLKGATINFGMDSKPNMQRGVNENDSPYSLSSDK